MFQVSPKYLFYECDLRRRKHNLKKTIHEFHPVTAYFNPIKYKADSIVGYRRGGLSSVRRWPINIFRRGALDADGVN